MTTRSRLLLTLVTLLVAIPSDGSAQGKTPNILVIFGDDVGWMNVSSYGSDLMGVPTPNIDRVAREGMRLGAFYAQPSCTAGRAAFITGQLPVRTGLTTVGTPGSPRGSGARTSRSLRFSRRRAISLPSSARTISAISTNTCRVATASTSSGATCTT